MEDQLELPKSTPLFGKRRFWIWILIVGVVSVSLFLLYTSEIIPRQVLNAVPEFADKHAEEGVLITASQQNLADNGGIGRATSVRGKNVGITAEKPAQKLEFVEPSSNIERDNGVDQNITDYNDIAPPTTKYPTSRLCTLKEYPRRFVLDTVGKDVQDDDVVLDACAPETLTIRAVGKNGKNVNCEPWVDMQGRILGPNLAKYPGPLQYSLYFNKVDVTYSSGGNFNVKLPSLEPGKYRLEIILAHNEADRKLVYDTLNQVPCRDSPVVNTPLSIIVIDKGKCAKLPKTTPLCTSGAVPGRWVTTPPTGCDGKVCEGDINVLASSRRVWAPYDCHYKLYGSDDLKKCIDGKKILIIGDSITEEITNEILQILYHRQSKPLLTKTYLVKNKLWLGRPTRWSQPLIGNSRIGFSFVMAMPLGCGITCVAGKSDKKLQRLIPHGKVDLLVTLTGLHDACPRRKNKTYDVFSIYNGKLKPYEEKLRKLLAEDGRIIWINSPESSGGHRCTYLSIPRLQRMSELTKEFLSAHEDVSFLDYLNISGSCNCGNEHKGIRFFKSSDASVGFNGFVSRMVAHIVLNQFCN